MKKKYSSTYYLFIFYLSSVYNICQPSIYDLSSLQTYIYVCAYTYIYVYIYKYEYSYEPLFLYQHQLNETLSKKEKLCVNIHNIIMLCDLLHTLSLSNWYYYY